MRAAIKYLGHEVFFSGLFGPFLASSGLFWRFGLCWPLLWAFLAFSGVFWPRLASCLPHQHLPTFFFDHAYLHPLASMLRRVRDKGSGLGLNVDVDQRDLWRPRRLRGMVDLLTMARSVCVSREPTSTEHVHGSERSQKLACTLGRRIGPRE